MNSAPEAGGSLCKTFEHPLVGTVAVNCDVLDIMDRDQRVVIYTATPGSSSEEALRMLRNVVGPPVVTR